MSIPALKWALELAPPMPAQLVATLAALANHADDEGRGAYPSVAKLAAYTCKAERTVRRDLRQLQELGMIRAGDPARVAHLPADRRPEVYDLAVEMVVPGGRAGSDEGSRAYARMLASARARGGRKCEPDELRGDVDVRADADVRGDVGVRDGGTWASQRGDVGVRDGGTWASAKPSLEPSLNRHGTSSGARASKPKQTPEQIVQSATDATEAEAAAVVGLISTEARQEIRNMPGFVRRLADDGELAEWLDRVRTDANRETVRRFVAGLPDLPPCVHGLHGGGALRPDTGEPQCASCRAVWRARSA